MAKNDCKFVSAWDLIPGIIEKMKSDAVKYEKEYEILNDKNSHPLIKYKAIYKIHNDDIFERAEGGNMCGCDPYILDWIPIFTPIEYDAWCSIRCKGVPFYPQYPVLNYILDFGNPIVKIGIECDGKEWHDEEKDKTRDENLFEEGWKIFRIPGKEFYTKFDYPYELKDRDYEIEQRKLDECEENWIMNTGDGVIESIMRVHFLKDYKAIHMKSLFNHSLIGYNTW